MIPIISKRIIVDTCFWFALFNKQDQYHIKASNYIEQIIKAQIIIPWPTLYEVFNTKFIKNRIALNQLDIILKKPNIQIIEDTKYKKLAFIETVEKSRTKKWNISLVDMIIRHMLLDTQNNIDYLITFNEKDFIDIIKKSTKTNLYYR